MSVNSIESLRNLFKRGKSADELLKSTEIIKKKIIGISNLDNKNPNSLPQRVFGNIVSHASIFFNMGKKNSKTGILIQYGKYEYIKKNKYILDIQAKTVWYVYGEKAGLIFGEIDYNDFIKEFCTICSINPVIDHIQITLKKFIEEVKKLGNWDLASYNFISNNCQNFVAAGIKVINPKYNPGLIMITDNSYFNEDDNEKGLPPVIIEQLNKRKIIL